MALLGRLAASMAALLVAAGAVRALLSPAALAAVGLLLLSLALAGIAAPLLAVLLPRRRLPRLHDRAIFVTGCDSGFGHKAALALDAAGAPVFAGCLFPDGDGAAALRRKASGRLRVVPLDVTNDASVADAARIVQKALEEDSQLALWAVVNNAGILKLGEAEWLRLDDLRAVMDVNLYGQVRVSQALLPLLKERQGRVVNLISLTCRIPAGVLTPYVVSKYAFLAYSDAMRAELTKFGVSVHSIEPWIFETPLVEKSIAVLEDSWKRAPEKIKESYGSGYCETLMKCTKLFINLTSEPSSKLHLVVDSIVDACLSEDPQSRYVPGFVGKLFDHFRFTHHFFQMFFHTQFLKIRKTS